MEKEIREMGESLGMPEEVFDNMFAPQPDLTPEWRPITLGELKKMDQEELDQLFSKCFPSPQ